MKQSILTYKSNGNDLTVKNAEIIPLDGVENVFYSDTTPDESEEWKKWYMIVFLWNGVYFNIGTYHLDTIKANATNEFYNKWIEANLSDAAVLSSDRYTRSIEIEILRRSGLKSDQFLQSVLDAKNEFLMKKEQKEKEEKEQERREQAEKEREYNERREKELNSAEQRYNDGEYINPELFVRLCERYGVSIPIQTKGMLMAEKRIHSVSRESYRYYTIKGKRPVSGDGIRALQKQLNEKMQ